MSAARDLDEALRRFADAAVEGREVEAREAFRAAAALMPASPAEVLAECRGWVAQEQQLMAGVSSLASDRSAMAALASARARAVRERAW